jgi:hypothetical protein
LTTTTDETQMETTSQGATALLALSHSPVEQALYEALRAATSGDKQSCVGSLSLRRLLELTGLGSYTTLRRARAGLVSKLSIDCKRAADDDGGALDLAADVVEALVDGRDGELDVRWRLVDGDGRPIRLDRDDIRDALTRRRKE